MPSMGERDVSAPSTLPRCVADADAEETGSATLPWRGATGRFNRKRCIAIFSWTVGTIGREGGRGSRGRAGSV